MWCLTQIQCTTTGRNREFIFFSIIYLFYSFNILHCTNVPYIYELHRHTMMNICSLKLVILLLRYTHSWGSRKTHNSWLTSSLINNFMTETVKMTRICKPSNTRGGSEGESNTETKGKGRTESQKPVTRHLDTDVNRKVCGMSVHTLIGCRICIWSLHDL